MTMKTDTFLKKGSDLVKEDVKVEWIVDRFIPKESITILHGSKGVGKAWLAMQIADAVSGGIRFMEKDTIKTPVTYVDLEDPLPILARRINKLDAHNDIMIWHNADKIKPPMIDSQDWVLYKQLQPGLVIFNTFNLLHGWHEDSQTHMNTVTATLRELKNIGLTILLLHDVFKAEIYKRKGDEPVYQMADHHLFFYKVDDKTYEKEVDDSNVFLLSADVKTLCEPYKLLLMGRRGFDVYQ